VSILSVTNTRHVGNRFGAVSVGGRLNIRATGAETKVLIKSDMRSKIKILVRFFHYKHAKIGCVVDW
jgi:hypothetical protein